MSGARGLSAARLDPVRAAGRRGRNHDLVLHARVAGYDPTWCEELLYARRELFEAYNKGLSLLPTSELLAIADTEFERAREQGRSLTLEAVAAEVAG